MHSRYTGQEIAVRAAIPLVNALLASDSLTPGLPSPEELSSPQLRMSWNQFLALVNMARAEFTDNELEAIGAAGLSSQPYQQRVRWVRRLLTLEDAFRIMVFPHNFIDYGCLQAAVDAKPGRVRITSILREGYEPSEALFLMLRGAAMELPRQFAAENVNVTGDLTGRYMHFDIQFSTASPRVSQTKRWRSAQLRNLYCAWNNTNAISELIERTFALEEALVERDKARHELEHDRQLHRRRMQNVTEVVVEYDNLNQIQYLSPNCDRVFGYPNSLLLSDPLRILRPQDRAAAEAAIANPGAIASGVYPIQTLHANGRLMQVEVTIEHFDNQQGDPHWLATFRDVGAVASRQPATLAQRVVKIAGPPDLTLAAPAELQWENDQPKLLLVDDDQMTRRIAQKILNNAGFSVLCVASGSEALAQIARYDFSGIVLDINMPDMSGIEVYEAMQSNATKMPVVFISGNPHQLIATYPNLAVLHKPFRSEQLVQTVREVIAA